MGAILEPTQAMLPWWGVEVRRESIYLTAREYSDWQSHERSSSVRAMAFRMVDGVLAAPGPATALLSAFDQALKNQGYKLWKADGHATSTDVSAYMSGNRIVLDAPVICYGGDADGGHLAQVEIEYAHVAALRDAVAALI